MRIYTREGDTGNTSVRGVGRVRKDAPRIEATGSVDELNSVVGRILARELDSRLRAPLVEIQKLLFRLGSDLANPHWAPKGAFLERSAVEQLERWIDEFSEDLPELSSFVLPGGIPEAADLHWARAICRRAERRSQTLATQGPASDVVIPFLNRLGDLLFVLARWANLQAGREEITWKP